MFFNYFGGLTLCGNELKIGKTWIITVVQPTNLFRKKRLRNLQCLANATALCRLQLKLVSLYMFLVFEL